MKFLVTAVTLSRETRRRRGKARTEVIDTDTLDAYRGFTDPMDVEDRYEALHDVGAEFVKVVDVREIAEARREPVASPSAVCDCMDCSVNGEETH